MKSLIYLLEGDIRQIEKNYNLAEKDNTTVREMRDQLLGDTNLCARLGWRKYKPGNKVLQTKAYLLALENYVSLVYGDKKEKEPEEHTC